MSDLSPLATPSVVIVGRLVARRTILGRHNSRSPFLLKLDSQPKAALQNCKNIKLTISYSTRTPKRKITYLYPR